MMYKRKHCYLSYFRRCVFGIRRWIFVLSFCGVPHLFYVKYRETSIDRRFRETISACKGFTSPLMLDDDNSSMLIPSPILDSLFQVDHIFVLAVGSCQLRIPSSFSAKATCVIGRNLDQCTPKVFTRGPYTHAMKVSFTHAVVLQMAHDAGYKHVAIIEDDVVLRRDGFSRNIAHDFGILLRSNSWSLIRFGFRPYFLEESSREHCPSKCRCTIHKHVGEEFCKLTSLGCDIRSSDFYVIHARFYLSLLSNIIDVKQASSKRIIDTRPMRRIAQQWLVLPQVSMQSQLDIPMDFQLGLGALYVKKCVHPRPLPARVARQFFYEKTFKASSSISSSKHVRLLVVILTAHRHESLNRLFDSLLRAEYGGAAVDIMIHVDGVENDHSLRERTVEFARTARWPHGKIILTVEKEKIGLRKSWLSVSPQLVHTHVAIFEDDMEVSSQFYTFFKYVSESNYFSRSTTLCLHPSDWELKLIDERVCEVNEVPDVQFYLTPEPCNWGPIWSTTAWRDFKHWAHNLETTGVQPFTPTEIGFNYNKYLKLEKDVQSPWVWRYNWESGRVQLRYSMTCSGGPHTQKYHMAVNHREPGNNFLFHASQEYHDQLTSLLATTPLVISTGWENARRPIDFKGYAEISLLLPPP